MLAKPGTADICATAGANAGHCGACDPTDSAECTTAASPICNPTTLACGACTTNAECLARAGAADSCVTGGAGSTVGSCAACNPQNDSGCAAPNDQCLAGATPVCADCDGANGCAVGAVCKDGANTCVECNTDGDCVGKVGTLACATAANDCVECTDNTDCLAGNLACKTQQCQACAADVDCTGHPTGTQCANTGLSNECRQCDPKTLGDSSDDEGCPLGKPCIEAVFTCTP